MRQTRITEHHDRAAAIAARPCDNTSSADTLAEQRPADWAALGQLVLTEARRRAVRAHQVRAAGGFARAANQPAGGRS